MKRDYKKTFEIGDREVGFSLKTINRGQEQQEQKQQQQQQQQGFEYRDIEFEDDNNNKEDIEVESKPTRHYHRLTYISLDACDFCTHVTKPGPYVHYISFETKNGWVSCGQEECKRRGKQAVDNFMNHEAYGRANHLKDRESINVKRTSGQMDSDWVLERSYPEVQMDDKGVEKVCVTKPSALIEKWVSIDNLLSWNSANE
jgi:hypothetical protein